MPLRGHFDLPAQCLKLPPRIVHGATPALSADDANSAVIDSTKLRVISSSALRHEPQIHFRCGIWIFRTLRALRSSQRTAPATTVLIRVALRPATLVVSRPAPRPLRRSRLSAATCFTDARANTLEPEFRPLHSRRPSAASLSSGVSMSRHAVSRGALDALARAAKLDAPASAQLLAEAGALPTMEEWRAALRRFALTAGVLALGCGVVFFIAANWSALSPGQRLALLQGLFALCIAIALWRAPPHPAGRAALLLGFIGAGALFALFGQTFQTGADVYELFLLWTALGLPFVIAARWPPVTAAWLLVGNLTLSLICGVLPGQHPLWLLLGFGRESWAVSVQVLMLPNLLLWAFAEWRAMHVPRIDLWLPRWLRRLLLVAGLGYGTFVASLSIIDSSDVAGVVSGYLIVAVLVGVFCFRTRREPLGPVALAASLVLIGLAVLIHWMPDGGSEVALFLLPLWVVASSTVAGVLLLPLVRRWEAERHAD